MKFLIRVSIGTRNNEFNFRSDVDLDPEPGICFHFL